MNEGKVVSCSDIMMKLANVSTFGGEDKISASWKTVVSKIHSNSLESEYSEKRMPIGERLASNTRVIDYKNGVLLIETDHSGWIQYLKFYQKFILTGLKRTIPDIEIHSLAFRIAGSKALLSEVYEKQVTEANQELTQKIQKTEEQLNSIFGEKKAENNTSNLPPEILEKFESIKKSVLTN